MSTPYRFRRPGLLLRPASQPGHLSPHANQENFIFQAHVVSAQTAAKEPRMPAEFKPRETKNMPFAEKITEWLAQIPWKQLESGAWVMDCFPGLPKSQDSDDICSEPDEQDICEHQARQITRMTILNYQGGREAVARAVSYGLSASYQHLDEGYFYRYAARELDQESM